MTKETKSEPQTSETNLEKNITANKDKKKKAQEERLAHNKKVLKDYKIK